ncbi:MAG: three-Cys-motif partner protein TcmP [Tepidisphaeraceae bacterium]|jgi:three-Cys-motif partner protein
MAKDRWPQLCELYKSDDRLPTRKVGRWTEDKLFFWNRYIEITTGAMVGHPKWPAGLVYVDLFAGPGICELEDSGRRMPGSILIAANAPKPFSRIIASEMESKLATALETRLKLTPVANLAKVFRGDCNVCIDKMVGEIPPRALTLAFIDPENLNVAFETIRKLSACGQVDLLILFADRMDLVRNVDLYERQQPSVLDRVMGADSDWRGQWNQLANRTPENICRLFADEFKQQLRRRLGYVVFGEKVISSEKAPLYRLIFASKNEKGLEFWNKITQKDRGGQMNLGF